MPQTNVSGSCSLKIRGKYIVDFSKVGGLDSHIQLLRELIVVPLLYQDLYSNFGVKPPKGILFYGPPGTGKTLVAGALASELSKEGCGKVQFFDRKGADILDKYVGESERKLREVFEKAMKSRPSVIFFDEIDGLAPSRSKKQDDMHCSVVATLLALMDGLNNTPGVVVIGATNRLEAIDPALRRPGRFDRELYFAVPCSNARTEILKVHMQSWLHKPSSEFISYLAELTTGFTGSDLQALCSEAFLCCIKRLYPNIQQKNSGNKININHNHIRVEETDFLAARLNIAPSMNRIPSKMKKLALYIRPLLQRQLSKIIHHIQTIWPHFTRAGFKFSKEAELYIGSMLLVGSNKQGLYNHMVPAILHALEHLPVAIVDANNIVEKILPQHQSIPHILLLSRVHDWWNSLDEAYRGTLISLLEDTHPSTPILIICSSDENVPATLLPFFADNSSIVIQIENPTQEEREEFFRPLFFSKSIISMETVLHNLRNPIVKNIKQELTEEPKRKGRKQLLNKYRTSRLRGGAGGNKKRKLYNRTEYEFNDKSVPTTTTKHNRLEVTKVISDISCSEDSSTSLSSAELLANQSSFENIPSSAPCAHHTVKHLKRKHSEPKVLYETESFQSYNRHTCDLTTPLTDLVNSNTNPCDSKVIKQEPSLTSMKHNMDHFYGYGDTPKGDAERTSIKNMFDLTVKTTTDEWSQSHLELLYRTIATCIDINKGDFRQLLQSMNRVLTNFQGI